MSEDISSDDLESLGSGQVYALEQFAVDELVLVRNVNRKDDFWPVRSPRSPFGPLSLDRKSPPADVWSR